MLTTLRLDSLLLLHLDAESAYTKATPAWNKLSKPVIL
jgi:hypothetical protein